VLEVNEAALVVRTNFFGWSPSGKVGILDYFYQALSTGTQPSGFFDYVTSSIYIPHLARLLWRSAKRDLNGILHLAASTPLSKLDFGRLVALYTGHSPNRVRRKSKASSPLLRTRGENLSLASHRAGRLLEVPMPTTESGIESAVADRAGTLSYFKRFGRWER
jgi:dTDP-4-dehydrorhamnose reductase